MTDTRSKKDETEAVVYPDLDPDFVIPNDEESTSDNEFVVEPDLAAEVRQEVLELLNNSHTQPKLPSHSSYDHHIDLVEGGLGILTQQEKKKFSVPAEHQEALRKFIKENLEKGFIRPSESPVASPLFFHHGKDGKLRPVIDYHAVNQLTVRSHLPTALLSIISNQIAKAKWLSVLELKSSFDHIRVSDSDVYLTSFNTDEGQFESLVMPSGLSTAPATFQRYINHVFQDQVGDFLYCYLDEVVVFSETKELHDQHLKLIINRLKEFHLQVNLENSELFKQEIEFFGHQVGKGEVKLTPYRKTQISDFIKHPPKNHKDLKSLTGLLSEVQDFVQHFAEIAYPLTKLEPRTTPFVWGMEQKAALRSLVVDFNYAPVLKGFDQTRRTRVFTNATQLTLDAVLEQEDPLTLRWHLVAFWSQRLQGAEINYLAHDKELFAIVSAFEKWRHFLHGVPHFDLFTDRKNLTYFESNVRLSGRQLQWSEIISEFSFTINYIEGVPEATGDTFPSFVGTDNPPISFGRDVSVDAIRRSIKEDWIHFWVNPARHTSFQLSELPHSNKRDFPIPAHIPRNRGEPLRKSLSDFLESTATELSVCEAEIGPVTIPPEEHELFVRAQIEDDNLNSVREAIINEKPLPKQFANQPFTVDNSGLMFFDKKPCVGSYPELFTLLVRRYHDDPLLGGHSGVELTIQKLKRSYYVPNIEVFVEHHIQSCPHCQTAKSAKQLEVNELMSLPVPSSPFESWSLDLITDLPSGTSGIDSILLVVDRFTKYVVAIPTIKSNKPETLAYDVLRRVILPFGPPKSIVTENGSQFESTLWKTIGDAFDTQLVFWTSYFPQADERSEKTLHSLEQYFRLYINQEQNEWPEHLPLLVSDINNLYNRSIKSSPTELITSQKLEKDLDFPKDENNLSAKELIELIGENR